jgi:hypothetical protein
LSLALLRTTQIYHHLRISLFVETTQCRYTAITSNHEAGQLLYPIGHSYRKDNEVDTRGLRDSAIVTLTNQTDHKGHPPPIRGSSEITENQLEDVRPQEDLEAGVVGLQDQLRPSSEAQRMSLPFPLPYYHPLSTLHRIL